MNRPRSIVIIASQLIVVALLVSTKGDDAPAARYVPAISGKAVIDRRAGVLVDVIMLPSVNDMVVPDAIANLNTIAVGMIETYTRQVNAVLAECRGNVTPRNFHRMVQASKLAAGLRLEG